MLLPDVWGQGNIFDFSELNEVNSLNNSLVGTRFECEIRRYFDIIPTGIKKSEYIAVASDIIHFRTYDRSLNFQDNIITFLSSAVRRLSPT